MNDTRVVKIKLYDYRLAESNLENLATEFYGKPLANLEMKSGFVEFSFVEDDYAEQFKKSLDCFKIDFGGKNPEL